jgi:hypothetical protein
MPVMEAPGNGMGLALQDLRNVDEASVQPKQLGGSMGEICAGRGAVRVLHSWSDPPLQLEDSCAILFLEIAGSLASFVEESREAE